MRLFNKDDTSLLASLINRQTNVRQLPLSKGMLPKEGRSGQSSPLSWKWSFRYLRKRFPHLRERLWAPYTVSEDRRAFIQIPTSWRERHCFKSEDYSPLWTAGFPCCGQHFTQEDNGRGFPALNFVAQLCEELFHTLRLERYSWFHMWGIEEGLLQDKCNKQVLFYCTLAFAKHLMQWEKFFRI